MTRVGIKNRELAEVYDAQQGRTGCIFIFSTSTAVSTSVAKLVIVFTNGLTLNLRPMKERKKKIPTQIENKKFCLLLFLLEAFFSLFLFLGSKLITIFKKKIMQRLTAVHVPVSVNTSPSPPPLHRPLKRVAQGTSADVYAYESAAGLPIAFKVFNSRCSHSMQSARREMGVVSFKV